MLAIYCRISKKKEEGKDVSILTQKEEGMRFAKSLGLKFKFFVDEGLSGTLDEVLDRPAFAELFEAIKRNEVTSVYSIDQSRIERNTRIWNIFVYIMTENNCKYYPNGKFFDLNNPENKLISTIISANNEFFAALTGYKVKLAINNNAKVGKTHGMTAFGYEKDDNGFFKINEEQAEIVKKIYKLSLMGNGSYTIAKILNSDAVPTKFNGFKGEIKRKDNFSGNITFFKKENVKWRGNVVYDMIVNPIYKGFRRWKDMDVKVPPIIDEDLWEKVNKNLQTNKKKVGKKEEYHYLLNSLIFCSDCGSELRGKKRLKGKDSAYKCKGKSTNAECTNRGINIAKIETFIIHHLFITKELEKHLSSLPSNSGSNNILKENIIKHLANLKKVENKIIKLRKLLIDEDLEHDEDLKNEYVTAKKNKENLQKNIEVIEKEIFESENDIAKSRLQNAIGSYEITASFEDTKQLVHSLIEEITIKHNKMERGGYFKLEIKYRGFPESSVFMTHWQAMKWHWISRYRSTGFTDEEVQDEIDALKWRLKKNGIEFSDDEFKDYEASERLELGLGSLQLKSEDLIYFD